MRLFERTFPITNSTRILDVGGSSSIWQFAETRPRLTILNFPSALESSVKSVDCVAGDGCMLPFKDNAFDIVFSNSVIEHVGLRDAQEQFANEVARVGQSYWIQTPNRKFPVEQHVMLPFIHYLPMAWQRLIIERFTLWQLIVKPSPAQRAFYLDHYLNQMRLLDKSELQALFPGAAVISEKTLGLAKSLIAIRTAK